VITILGMVGLLIFVQLLGAYYRLPVCFFNVGNGNLNINIRSAAFQHVALLHAMEQTYP